MEIDTSVPRRKFLKGLAAVTALVSVGALKPADAKPTPDDLVGPEPPTTPLTPADRLTAREFVEKNEGAAGRLLMETRKGSAFLDGSDTHIDPAFIYRNQKDIADLRRYPPHAYTPQHPAWPNKRVLVYDTVYGPFILVAKAVERPDFYQTADGWWIDTTEISHAFREKRWNGCPQDRAGMDVWMRPESMSFDKALEKRRQYDAKSGTDGNSSDPVHRDAAVRSEPASEASEGDRIVDSGTEKRS